MKRSLIACTLALMVLAGAWAVNAASPNYSGSWVLDKAKSQGLPPQLGNVESYTMLVTQDDKQITVENKVVGGNRGGGEPGAPGGSATGGQDRVRGQGGGAGQGGGRRAGGAGGAGGQGGGRGGGGGFGMGMGVATYQLDGSETKIESAGGRGGAATLKAQWKDSGKSLELTNTRSINFQGNETTRTTKERWELSEGGKVLKVKRATDGRQGTQEFTLVFNRQ
jgi:hypothetical protein